MKYLVRLKPLDSFFFSGQDTFKAKDGRGKEKNNHYVVSERYPQQTTLLGVIRKELLIKKEWYRENREDYAKDVENKILDSDKLYELVGQGSFKANEEYKGKGFGIIDNISPIFLNKNNEFYIETPLDNELIFKDENKGRTYLGNTIKNKIFLLDKYDPKKGLNRKIRSCNPYQPKNNYSLDEIFKDDLRVGIDIHNEEAFFKQKFYRLEKNWEFSFLLDLKEDIFKIEKNKKYETTIYMGGESKPFRMIIEKSTKQIYSSYDSTKERIVLIGDAIITETNYKEIEKNSIFILGELKYFKNFRVVKGKHQKSDSILILKGGSVIFVEEKKYEEVINLIKNKNNEVIGYNHILGGE